MTTRDNDVDGFHGLVAAAVVEGGEIQGFVMSYRVIGLRVEQILLSPIVEDAGASEVVARIVETPCNGPVRNLYRDGGFRQDPNGIWIRAGGDTSAAA